MEHNTKLLILPAVPHMAEVLKEIGNTIDVTTGTFSDVEFIFKNDDIRILHKGIDLKDFSIVWLSSLWHSRDTAYAVKLYLDRHHIRHSYVEKSTSKITDQLSLIFSGVRFADTFFVNTDDFSKYIDKIEEVCSYPMIIKDTKGYWGKNSALASNREDLIEKLSKLPKAKQFFIQRFIPNEYDWGVMVVNGEVVSAEKSYPVKGEFRNNVGGATEKFTAIEKVPNEVQEMAINASKILGLSWSRSDIIVDKNTGVPYMLEVNRTPGITLGSTEVDGARKFLESLLRT